MRRKVLRHFANMFPQRFLELPCGYDVAVCARHKMGVVHFDFLNGTAVVNGVDAPEMHTARDYREWLNAECTRHRILVGALEEASMRVEFLVTDYKERRSFSHVFRSAHFHFDCRSCVRTDEKVYASQKESGQYWGFDWFWEQLYGGLPLKSDDQ